MAGGSGFQPRFTRAIAVKKPLPQSKNNRFKTTKFLFRSDWTLAASGGARMKSLISNPRPKFFSRSDWPLFRPRAGGHLPHPPDLNTIFFIFINHTRRRSSETGTLYQAEIVYLVILLPREERCRPVHPHPRLKKDWP